MFIKQLYTNCLAEAAYYIESEGEAAIIDPLRETAPYLALAKERNATIRYIFETHFHADFVSGHIDLARETGAAIIYGPGAKAHYDILSARQHEIFPLGNIKIKVLHTPGHTLESSCFLLIDENGKENAVFTGDTLFAGDVGRPDLATSKDITKEDLAEMLHDSIYAELMPLADDVIVYPGHGPGSACGKNIGTETVTTIGKQKQFNYALQPMTRDEFIHVVTAGLEEPPKYFFMDAAINKNGYQDIDSVMKHNAVPISPEQFKTYAENGNIILDTRNADEFEKGFIPGAINIGLSGQYAIWVGSLLDAKIPVILVTDLGKEQEAILRLARVGYENVKGYLDGGMVAWENAGLPVDTIESINPEEFVAVYNNRDTILDIRNDSEAANEKLSSAIHIPLAKLESFVPSLNKQDKIYIHCAGGYRSMIASSILQKHGFEHVINIRKGIKGLKEAGVLLAV